MGDEVGPHRGIGHRVAHVHDVRAVHRPGRRRLHLRELEGQLGLVVGRRRQLGRHDADEPLGQQQHQHDIHGEDRGPRREYVPVAAAEAGGADGDSSTDVAVSLYRDGRGGNRRCHGLPGPGRRSGRHRRRARRARRPPAARRVGRGHRAGPLGAGRPGRYPAGPALRGRRRPAGGRAVHRHRPRRPRPAGCPRPQPGRDHGPRLGRCLHRGRRALDLCRRRRPSATSSRAAGPAGWSR